MKNICQAGFIIGLLFTLAAFAEEPSQSDILTGTPLSAESIAFFQNMTREELASLARFEIESEQDQGYFDDGFQSNKLILASYFDEKAALRTLHGQDGTAREIKSLERRIHNCVYRGICPTPSASSGGSGEPASCGYEVKAARGNCMVICRGPLRRVFPGICR